MVVRGSAGAAPSSSAECGETPRKSSACIQVNVAHPIERPPLDRDGGGPGTPGDAAKGRRSRAGTQGRPQSAAGARAGAHASPAPALQLAGLALFSTSLSPNQDQNHTNMLKSPPKLLFWFQDDAIWVPVSCRQGEGRGRRPKCGSGAKLLLGNAAAGPCSGKPSPGPNPALSAGVNPTPSCIPYRAPDACRRAPISPKSQQNQRLSRPACAGSIPPAAGTNLGRLWGGRGWIQSGPRGISKRHIYS